MESGIIYVCIIYSIIAVYIFRRETPIAANKVVTVGNSSCQGLYSENSRCGGCF